VKFVAGKQGVRITDDAKVSAAVGIGPIPTGFALKVDLSVSLPGVERTVAEKLVADAHIVCPYSNATRNNVEVSLTVV
jgi:Ohr subfamily peroxiredoxin